MPPGRRLKWLCAGALCAVASAWGVREYGAEFYNRYERWRWPAIRQASPLAADIEEDRRKVEYLEMRARYMRVGARVQTAGKQRLRVDFLKPKMNKAKDLIERGKFSYARTLLNAIELQIPTKSEKVQVAEQEDIKAEDFFRDRGRRGKSRKTSVQSKRRRRRR